jgi:hypothetical protein
VKARIRSDHCPLILNTVEQGDTRPRYFFLDEQWLQKEGFSKMVQDRWSFFKGEQSYSLDRWHGCLQSMRKYLRGSNLQLIGDQRKDKNNMARRIQDLDKIAENRLLSIQEWEERIEVEDRLESLNRAEELH